jgi:WD40 repeat protein
MGDPADRGESENIAWDVFVSYSHSDKAFAIELERALKRYSPPFWTSGSRRRLRVFRDESEAASNVLTAALETALRRTRKLVVVCSPASRDSPWVNREIDFFAKHRSAGDIVPILVAGRSNSEAIQRGRSEDAAFSPLLLQALGGEPWAPDFRDTGAALSPTRRRNDWWHLLAEIFGVSRAQIESRERIRTLVRLAATVLVVSGIGLASYAFLAQRRYSESLRLAEESSRASLSRDDHEPRLRLALEAVTAADTPQAREALKTTLEELQRGSRSAALIAIDKKGAHLAVAPSGESVRLVDLKTLETHVLCGHVGNASVHFSPDSRWLVTVSGLQLQVFDVRNGRRLGMYRFIDATHGAVRAAQELWISPDGETLLGQPPFSPIQVWSLPTLRPLGELAGTLGEHLVAFSPAGKTLATAYKDAGSAKLTIWSNGGQSLWSRQEGVANPAYLGYGADGGTLTLLSRARWDPSETTKFLRMSITAEGLPADTKTIAQEEFLEYGSLAAVADVDDENKRIGELEEGLHQLLAQQYPDLGPLSGAWADAQGKTFVVGSSMGLLLFSLPLTQRPVVIDPLSDGAVHRAEFTPDGRTLLVTAKDYGENGTRTTLRVWSVPDRRSLWSFSRLEIDNAWMAHDGNTIYGVGTAEDALPSGATGPTRYEALAFDTRSGRRRCSSPFSVTFGRINDRTLWTAGDKVVSYSKDGVHIWAASDCKLLMTATSYDESAKRLDEERALVKGSQSAAQLKALGDSYLNRCEP